MDNTNSKVITLSFAALAGLVGLTVHLLLKSFSAAFGVVARMSGSDLVRHGLPIVSALILFAILQFNPRVLAWADEVVTEIRKVVWPTRKDVVAMTIVVCVMVIISSIVISAFDFASAFFIRTLMN